MAFKVRYSCMAIGLLPSKAVQETAWFIENLQEKTMLKRIGQPEDLSGALILLASDASAFMTGANISVDGGWIAW
ncbi:SDR family oxidoreductase [Oscillospiraceae bacterium 38-13]